MRVMALEAHVVNGRIVLDEPVELPEGATVEVHVSDPLVDAMSDQEREALERSLARGVAQAKAGDLIDADEVLAELRR